MYKNRRARVCGYGDFCELAPDFDVILRWVGYMKVVGGFHLELVHGLAGAGHDQLVAAVAVTGHFVVSPFCFVFFCLLWMIFLDGTSAAILRPGGAFYTRGGFPVSVIFPCNSSDTAQAGRQNRGCNLDGSEYNGGWTTE